MKRLIILALILLTGFQFASANNKEKVVDSKIKHVTVFTQGAQVTRSASISVGSGTTDIVMEGISPYLNPNSLKAGGKGNFVIMGVRNNTKYIAPGQKKSDAVPSWVDRRLKEMSDSLTELGFEIEALNFEQDSWTREKNMLLNAKVMNGGGNADSLPVFMSAMDFFRKKIHEINDALLGVKKNLYRANNKKSNIQARMNELNQYKYRLNSENSTPAKYIYQVIITVSAKAKTVGTLDVSYLVNNASWSPSYDLRATEIDEPVALTYKAHIVQNTGVSWDNVKLTLSTLNPNRSNVKPVLPIWYLGYYNPMAYSQYNLRSQVQSNTMMVTEVAAANVTYTDNVTDDAEEYEFKKDAQIAANYVQAVTSFTNVEFEIALKYSIPADGKSHQVAILESDVDASYHYSAVPKIERETFLSASLTDWEKLNLLPAAANIYYKNTIIGTTFIDPNQIIDTLDLSLGRDQGVVINRKKINDEESSKIIGHYKEKTITIEISVKNKKSSEIEIDIEDQIPLPNTDDIKVTFDDEEDSSGAEYNEKTGKLNWKIKVKPNETKTLTFTYTIKYDKSKTLTQ